MTLPILPLLKSLDETEQQPNIVVLMDNVETIYNYMQNLLDVFANSVGEAIDPIYGQSGDGSLNIIDAPSGIAYTPGSTLSIDNVLFGHVDIVFTLPSRSIGALVYYRETGITNFKTSFAKASPYRLPNLKVGTQYDLALAGQAANGDVGPLSTVTMLTIPTTSLVVIAPTGLQAVATYETVVLTWVAPVGGVLLEFEVQSADDSGFTTNVTSYSVDSTHLVDDLGESGVTKYYRVRSVDRSGLASSYTSAVSATTANIQVTASRILGRGDSGAGDVQELTVDSDAFSIVGTELQNSSDTGWAVSNVSTDRVYDADATTLDEIADVLGTLITVLIAKKVLGA